MRDNVLSKFTNKSCDIDCLKANQIAVNGVDMVGTPPPSSACNGFVKHSLPSRKLEVDDVLWFFMFALTCWYFGFPIQLLIHPWVDRLIWFLKLEL
uniref:Transmembrane protein n=1 Tax=Syphacia muris TaxID=451379 RepID=A0A0N5AVK6_9BILA